MHMYEKYCTLGAGANKTHPGFRDANCLRENQCSSKSMTLWLATENYTSTEYCFSSVVMPHCGLKKKQLLLWRVFSLFTKFMRLRSLSLFIADYCSQPSADMSNRKAITSFSPDLFYAPD